MAEEKSKENWKKKYQDLNLSYHQLKVLCQKMKIELDQSKNKVCKSMLF